MTKIEWTEETWNPFVGCSIVSAGCRNCYAMRLAHRLAAMGQAKYAGTTVSGKRGPVWTGRVNLDAGAVGKPFRQRRPTVWFVNSMSDLFHEEAPDEWRDRVFAVMMRTPHHTYQVLTKRPENAARYYVARSEIHRLPNVWLGVSVEDARVIHRLDALREIPAAIRFASVEPLIGPVGDADFRGIDWVIVGGESGPRARPMEPAWVDEAIERARAAGAAVFFKQWGTWRNNPLVRDGMSVDEAKRHDPDPLAKGGAGVRGVLLREMPVRRIAA